MYKLYLGRHCFALRHECGSLISELVLAVSVRSCDVDGTGIGGGGGRACGGAGGGGGGRACGGAGGAAAVGQPQQGPARVVQGGDAGLQRRQHHQHDDVVAQRHGFLRRPPPLPARPDVTDAAHLCSFPCRRFDKGVSDL